jgi:hypothetical protein
MAVLSSRLVFATYGRVPGGDDGAKITRDPWSHLSARQAVMRKFAHLAAYLCTINLSL